MNTDSERSLPSWLPLAVGAMVASVMVAAGVWQLDRGGEKRADLEAFTAESGYTVYSAGADIELYQNAEVTGTLLTDRQLLLDHIIENGRIGYYVITPLRLDDGSLLLVNRGWVAKVGDGGIDEDLSVDDAPLTVRGRAGRLPRAAYRMGHSIPVQPGWPKIGVYPTLEEVADVLAEPLAPFVLLLDGDQPAGFARNWQPAGFGPERHYGYALQWFAMSAVLAGLLIWNYRKKRLT